MFIKQSAILLLASMASALDSAALELAGLVSPADTGGSGSPCQCGERVIEFDFSNLEKGAYVTEISKNNLSVTAIGKGEAHTPDANNVHVPEGGAARVFDSSRPQPDLDLGSPNESCGGPGVGAAGAKGMAGENCIAQGNLLIVQRRDKDRADDAEGGGKLVFTVDPSVNWRFSSVGILDIALNERVDIITVLRYSGESLTTFFEGLGPNSFQEISYANDPIRYTDTVTIDLPSDGGVSKITFCESFGNDPDAPVPDGVTFVGKPILK